MIDMFDPEGPDESGEEKRPLGRQLVWFAGIAIASLIVVGVIAYGLRGLLLIG